MFILVFSIMKVILTVGILRMKRIVPMVLDKLYDKINFRIGIEYVFHLTK